VNKVIISGNLCRDVELRQTNGGKSVVNNCVAVSRDRKEEDGSRKADFINIVVFGHSAEYLAKYSKKGDRVEIAGRWQVRTYETEKGTQTANECVVESISAYSQTKNDEPKPVNDEQKPVNDERIGTKPAVWENPDDLPF
jgi:single-strand DNA-binding protein